VDPRHLPPLLEFGPAAPLANIWLATPLHAVGVLLAKARVLAGVLPVAFGGNVALM